MPSMLTDGLRDIPVAAVAAPCPEGRKRTINSPGGYRNSAARVPQPLVLAVMIAALLFVAILDLGPLVGVGANANAILTLLAALVFVVVHGYIGAT